MRSFFSVFSLAMLTSLAISLGCDTSGSSTATPTDGDSHGDQDHGDHDHGDHDHGEHGHDHDGHDHDNLTLGGLLDEIEETRAGIASAFADGSPEDAHDSMHSVGHLIEDLTEASESLSLSDEQSAQLKEAQESLFNAFGAIDEGMHGEGGKTYDEVASEITSAMETLKGFVPEPSE